MKNIWVEEGETDIEIYADSLFEKVVYNLIENAIRYGEKIMVIRWYAYRIGNTITLMGG